MTTLTIVDEQAKCGTKLSAVSQLPGETADSMTGVIASIPAVQVFRRRRIGYEAGRGLEMLGHAIEYLADEYAHTGGDLATCDAELKAIQILMALNREIYFACPVTRTIRERWSSFVRATIH
jgi:hypothetical protein